MKRRLFFSTGLAAAALAAIALPALAQDSRPYENRLGALMQVSIVDRASGRELPIYRHRGEYWVAGRPGARYAIRLRNAIGERVMAVMSIDGINVLSGETAGYGQNGYVFDGGERSDIAGWRKSDSQIAAFEFTSVGNSYASRTGRPDDVGVIGVALFRERAAPPPSIHRRDSTSGSESRKSEGLPVPLVVPAPLTMPAPPAAAAPQGNASPSPSSIARAAPSPSLGTGHGRRETSYIGHTDFDRAQEAPNELIRIRYDSRDNLVAAGVIPPARPTRWPRAANPSPFPESTAGYGYVPDPPSR
jgi:hypothetical protein